MTTLDTPAGVAVQSANSWREIPYGKESRKIVRPMKVKEIDALETIRCRPLAKIALEPRRGGCAKLTDRSHPASGGRFY